MMKNTATQAQPRHLNHHRQKGAALVLSLIVLAVLTIFAITSINISNTEEVMARNTTGYKIALTSAEAALQDGIDNVVDPPNKAPSGCTNLGDTNVACDNTQFYELTHADNNIDLSNSHYDWSGRASDIKSVSDTQLAAITGSTNNIPQRIVTHRPIPGSGSLDAGRSKLRQAIYEVSAIGHDANGKSTVVIRQSLVRNEVK